MVSFTIHNLGSFMSKLLSSDCFDSFLLEEAVICMAVTYTVDGHLNRDFFEDAVWEDPAQRPFALEPWSEARGICRDMIKGKKAPASFRITLQLKPEYMEKTLSSGHDADPATIPSVGALVLNIRLDDGICRVVTGVAMRQFTMDKSPDRIWDAVMEKFLAAKEISFEKDG